jgi:hypothetical protein
MAAYYVRQGILAFLNVLVGFGVGIALLEAAATLLNRLVYPPAGNDIVLWLSAYRAAALDTTITAMVLTSLWHLIALPGSGRKSDKRNVWILLVAVSAASGVLFWLLRVPAAISGSFWGFVFCLFQGPLAFWSGTVLFTPAPFKFTPLLSQPIRRW